uniref:Homing endonuclease LAGLIDADG domain-containing protein n=1 Tax=Cantharellus cibarius TaxID=36066 RepID=A0A2U3TMM0_CANCI|nr:hypothetical protein [Cantharellus cibarius]AWA82172.1 hypothetical protein [Cantharellus cibarius]
MRNNNKINNIRDGYHLNSKYWQDIKKTRPNLNPKLINISIGMLLGDATMYKVSRNALIKFEQGYRQESFIDHLFNLFKDYTFMLEPGKRIELHHPIRKGEVKSYWFKTFSHTTFNELWDLFYMSGNKRIPDNLHLSEECIAYWIMCDGSLDKDKKTMILHSKSYSFQDNIKLSTLLNVQWGLNTKVIAHKDKYHVIKIPSSDSLLLNSIISNHIIESMSYKLPIKVKMN